MAHQVETVMEHMLEENQNHPLLVSLLCSGFALYLKLLYPRLQVVKKEHFAWSSKLQKQFQKLVLDVTENFDFLLDHLPPAATRRQSLKQILPMT